ncbi:hypothetical protein JCM10212_000432 [Sporobolomyces blumeae]
MRALLTRQEYAASPSQSTPPLASTSATLASSSPSSSSSRKPRTSPHRATTTTSETFRARNLDEGAFLAMPEAVSENRVIGRARSEVDIRSRSRRPVDAAPPASMIAGSGTVVTPSTSPTSTRSRPGPSPNAAPSTPAISTTSPTRTDFAGSPASFVTARSIPVRTPPPRPVRSPHRDSSPCPPSTSEPRERTTSARHLPPPADLAPRTASAPQLPTQKTLIHGTEFEIVSTVSPPLPPSTFPSSPPRSPRDVDPMSAFTFPPSQAQRQQRISSRPPPPSSPTGPARNRRSPPPSTAQKPVLSEARDSSESVFRLDRPHHALPDSYLALRESLTQSQIDDFAKSFARHFPAGSIDWNSTAGPVMAGSAGGEEGQSASGEAGRGGRETEDWAQQRRMSSLLSGLGVVLGSSSFSAGALLMEEEEEGEEEDDLHDGSASPTTARRTTDQFLATAELPFSFGQTLDSPLRADQARRVSVMTTYESAEEFSVEGEAVQDRDTTPRSRTTSYVDSDALAGVPALPDLDFDPLSIAQLSSGAVPLPLPTSNSLSSISSRRASNPIAVAFGYACGDSEEPSDHVPLDKAGRRRSVPDPSDRDAGAGPSSIRQLVRNSWRLSSSAAGSREFKPLSPKRHSMREPLRFDDGLGIVLDEIAIGEGLADGTSVKGGTPSSYTPSSRPVMPPRTLSITDFRQTTSDPVSPAPSALPTSPPLVASTSAQAVTASPATLSTEAFSPTASLPSTPAVASRSMSRPSLTTHSAPDSFTLSASQSRKSSLAPSVDTARSLRRRSSNEEGLLSRRPSAIGGSKSTKRIAALFSSGMDKVRTRQNSHNSNAGDDERETSDGRTSRRRALTDGLISGPISTPSLSASTSASPLPTHSSRAALAPPSGASTPLTQSPFQGRTWRSTLPPDQAEALAEELGAMEMRRQEVIWELCETERSFVNGLRGVIQVFTLPLRTRTGTWIKGVPVGVSRLLDWLDDIVYLHSQVSAALEEARASQHPVVDRIADCFLPFVARLEVHQPYLVRFETVTRSIDDMTADSTSDFGEFVRMQSSLPECGSLSLSSFLLKPVQRLMKYPLFFRQLCDLTPSTHPDHFSTLSLLHSTDSIIRVMQEVKTREDEYQEAKVLESRISGLPAGFRLACRDRRLVAHGVLKRVHVSDKDRSLLEMDAIARAGKNRPAFRGTAHAPTSPGLSPIVDNPRPQSTISDSSSSSLSAGSLTYASDATSTGWNSPTTPSTFPSPGRFDLSSNSPGPSPHLRPDSMISNSSSMYSEDSYKATPSAFASHPANRKQPATRRVVKTKAKETSVYAFVFSDLIVLATKSTPTTAFMKQKAGARRPDQIPAYRALDTIGLSRVLGVSDLTGKTEHDHLIEVDLLPIREGQENSPLSLSNSSLASSIYLTLPPPSSSRSPLPPSATADAQFKERIRWLQAIERSYLFALRSLSFPSVLSSFGDPTQSSSGERLSCASYLDAGIVPKSPSQQLLDKVARGENGETTLDGAELEREERGWWAVRLKKVRREMEETLRGGPPDGGTMAPSPVPTRSPAPTPLASSTSSSSSRRSPVVVGGVGTAVRPGKMASIGVGQVFPRRMD